MEQPSENNLISEWAGLICDLSQQGQSVAIGVFNTEGQLLEANPAMCYFLDTEPSELKPKNLFINPEFSTFFIEKKEGIVFEGLLTIGNYNDLSYVLSAKVFRRNDLIMVYAEADVAHLFEENNKMSTLNQEVNNLQRQLIKEKKNLQNTLSELKETQQMLIHSEKMNAMGKLVAGVAHELNNPIAFVYSNLFSLEKYIAEVFDAIRQIEQGIESVGNQELSEIVAQLREKNDLDYLEEDISDMTKESKVGIERVKTIVEDLRRFSRLDESDIKQVDLIENIRSTESIVRAEIAQKNIQYQYIGPSQLQLECYPGQLNQAILNVLINAIDAVQPGGLISLIVTEDKDKISIEVTDNGCGIQEEIKNRIFEPFFTTKPVGSGTGLGLSITYKIIHDLHKGSIEVDSVLQHGTKIKLSIPKII
ncbi:MAG: ATP-binding protein [Bacteroidota bacterium]|nr:ATP-binding protein [Bacteroidota bacterium]